MNANFGPSSKPIGLSLCSSLQNTNPLKGSWTQFRSLVPQHL